jgi:ElaB/YqjD/DUF883 family membrane-anchored ribosome-binding protein
MSTDQVKFPTADDSGFASSNDPSLVAATRAAADKSVPAGGKLLGRIVDGAHQTIDKLAERAGPRVEQLEHSVQDANHVLQQRAERARDVGDEWLESMRTSVREHPVAAIGVALAVGVLVARMSQR